MSPGHKWTKAQEQALYTRNKNILVSAGAGSGKTAVLVERVFQIINQTQKPVDIDHLLVLTFTNAAAAEMRSRVAERLQHEIYQQNAHQEHLEKQMRLLPQANITTFHSFCREIVRQHSYLINLDPEFRVADEQEVKLMQQDALETVLEKYYQKAAEHQPNWREMFTAYGGDRDDSNLRKLIIRLFDYARSSPFPDQWLEHATRYFTEQDQTAENPWQEELHHLTRYRLRMAQDYLQAALNIAVAPGGPCKYEETLQQETEGLEHLQQLRQAGWDEVRAKLNGFSFTSRLPSISVDEGVDPYLKQHCGKLRNKAKQYFQKLCEEIYNRSWASVCEETREMRPLLQCLIQVVQSYGQKYGSLKANSNVLDFFDLEHFCLQILTNSDQDQKLETSEVARELQEKFAEVLVDEYQDVNLVQDTILKLVSRVEAPEGSCNLFMVGDVKQSIYRFRLAEPDLFIEKYENYCQKGRGKSQRITLTHNFRSAEGIIDAVNYVFCQLMTREVGEVRYDKNAELVCGRESQKIPLPVSLHLLESKPTQEVSVAENACKQATTSISAENDRIISLSHSDALQREAYYVARLIKEMVEGDTKRKSAVLVMSETGETRSVKYKDIVILLRAMAGKAYTYLQEFNRAGVPVFAKTSTGYFETLEVNTFLSLLKIIDNPRQEIDLATVLRSPIGGFSAEELAFIRTYLTTGNFYDAITKASQNTSKLGIKAYAFLKKLSSWRTYARQESLADLIWHLFRNTWYYEYVGGLPQGGARQANLRALYDRARTYEQNHAKGLFAYLRYINQLREEGQDLGPAPVLTENEDVVRIMSVHQSKGLEFPVVILADLGRPLSIPEDNNQVQFHKNLGLGTVYIDTKQRVEYPTLSNHILREETFLKNLAEEMRILYVGMTRAKEKLILVGSQKKLEEKMLFWQAMSSASSQEQVLPDAVRIGADSYLDWLMPALLKHPDAEDLRRQFNYNLPLRKYPGSSRWDLELVPHPECPPAMRFAQKTDKVNVRKEAEVDARLQKQVDKCLDWEYPHKKITQLPAKISVSEIKRRFDDLDPDTVHPHTSSLYEMRRPLFVQKKRQLSGREYGIVMHTVLQNMDLTRNLDEKDVALQVEGLRSKNIITETEASAVNCASMAQFFSSSLGTRLLVASDVKRELPFCLNIPANRVYPDLEEHSEENVLVQGVIDCAFAENDGWVLLDYKTEMPQTSPDSMQNFRIQMGFYKLALERIWKVRVKNSYLYFFANGTTIEL